jgi:hypothetical protein
MKPTPLSRGVSLFECKQLGYLALLAREEFDVNRNNGFLIKEDDELYGCLSV